MLKKYTLLVILLTVSVFSNAEVRPYINADFGFADTDFDTSLSFDIGGGVQFNEHFEFEVAYNHYGDTGPFGLDITSISYGINLGGKVSETTRLFAILGSEKLEADGSASIGPFSVDVDESSTEAFWGIGASFQQKDDNFELRTRLVSHDSGDIISLRVGLVFYF